MIMDDEREEYLLRKPQRGIAAGCKRFWQMDWEVHPGVRLMPG